MHYILKYYYKWLSINIIKYAHSQYVLCKCTIGRLYVCNNFPWLCKGEIFSYSRWSLMFLPMP